MKIAFVLGEESADRIGADLLRGLRRGSDEPIEAIGLGGDAMRAEGLESLFDIEDLSIIGIGAIVARLPKLLGRLRQTVDFLVAERPDAVVTIDSFTFTNRVALRVRTALPQTLIVNVVPPAIWAYRPQRAQALAAAVDHSFSLFPFEPAVLAEHGGPPATYVGHPLMGNERLARLIERDRLVGMRQPAAPPRLLILPGSRRGEISRLMDDFGRTFALLSERIPGVTGVLPAIPRVRSLIEDKLKTWPVRPEVVEGEDAKWQAFASADAALAASGTVALELALAGIPMALCYRVDPLTYLLRHMITAWTAALPNFIAGHPLVPEHFHEFIRPEALARRLERLMTETPERHAQMAGFAEIRRAMSVPTSPGETAAKLLLEQIARRRLHSHSKTGA